MQVILGPLKSIERSLEKAFHKYGGDFRALTDLARMNFECGSLGVARDVLKAILRDARFEVCRIKDRLSSCMDTNEVGNYRDLQLSVVSKASGHIFEIQISLRGVAKVSLLGGLSAYKLAETFGFFKKEVVTHQGLLTTSMMTKMECGILKHVECRGWADLQDKLPALVRALSAPSCQLNFLKLVQCDWPHGAPLMKLLTPAVCKQLGPHLETLAIFYMDFTGRIWLAGRQAEKQVCR